MTEVVARHVAGMWVPSVAAVVGGGRGSLRESTCRSSVEESRSISFEFLPHYFFLALKKKMLSIFGAR